MFLKYEYSNDSMSQYPLSIKMYRGVFPKFEITSSIIGINVFLSFFSCVILCETVKPVFTSRTVCNVYAYLDVPSFIFIFHDSGSVRLTRFLPS